MVPREAGKGEARMEKTLACSEVRRHLGRILQEVATQGDCVVVARYGQPLAALVPLELYEQLQQAAQPPTAESS